VVFNSSFRFKEHVQNNLPRDLLTGEQFIQLRRELASVNGHSGDDGPPGDDLPSGIEDITDPAKVTLLITWSVNKKLGSRNGMVIKCAI
jgi:hypothetical protein